MQNQDYIFIQSEVETIAHNNLLVKEIIEIVANFANETKSQHYIIQSPLGENKYSYGGVNSFVVLSTKTKPLFIKIDNDEEIFENYQLDFIEDLGSLSDKFNYRQYIGRPRDWQKGGYFSNFKPTENSVEQLIEHITSIFIDDVNVKRITKLIVSVLIGSINNVSEIGANEPESRLEKIKNKIVLFDGTQTYFIFGKIDKKTVRIQGLSGTGKTELLLHKLKEVFVTQSDSLVLFTCHNRILADKLKKRIPKFFDFLKVEKQIEWGENLLCTHAWGSRINKMSGAYSYICQYYGINFETYNRFTSFKSVCKNAIDSIKNSSLIDKFGYAFGFSFVDESQDFAPEFMQLIELVTEKRIILAGDIFQSIFSDASIGSIEPEFILKKCYRTDPRTLMAAHAIGMGLFEPKPLRWLTDSEWDNCGYKITRQANNNVCELRRDPISRFEDIDIENYKSVSIEIVKENFFSNLSIKIIDVIKRIKAENETVTPDDIGIIILDDVYKITSTIDELKDLIQSEFSWDTNLAYDEKRTINNTLFLSNRNNVKGLEFPFVICVCQNLEKTRTFRNGLYMAMTRSFLQTFLLLSENNNHEQLKSINKGIDTIGTSGFISVDERKFADITKETTIKYNNTALSLEEFIDGLFEKYQVPEIFTNHIKEVILAMHRDTEYDIEFVEQDFVDHFQKTMKRKKQ